MSKITFPDKVAVNPVQGLLINNITDADMNEVKASVNALYDVVDINIANISTLQAQMLEVQGRTGFGDYVDTQYTEESPFVILSGVENKVTLPNNAGTKVEIQKPLDVSTFYDPITQTITGRNGDAALITIEVRIKPLSAASNIRVRLSIDIGGTVGEIYLTEQSLTKGNGVEHYYLKGYGAYTLGTWEENGGAVKIESIGSDIAAYKGRYVIVRLHKARPTL